MTYTSAMKKTRQLMIEELYVIKNNLNYFKISLEDLNSNAKDELFVKSLPRSVRDLAEDYGFEAWELKEQLMTVLSK